ncbi:hypothetical protein [Streptomyces sp. NPDC058953]|uniref:hypothetical protein n=1 Tax=unclassified Streptomyces TaxID=2593676 RepID=UPI00367B527E
MEYAEYAAPLDERLGTASGREALTPGDRTGVRSTATPDPRAAHPAAAALRKDIAQ